MSRKPDLPDPGEGKWWEITRDVDGDYTIGLYTSEHVGGYEQNLIVLTVAYIPSYQRPKAEDFEDLARELLNTYDADNQFFVGTYHRN